MSAVVSCLNKAAAEGLYDKTPSDIAIRRYFTSTQVTVALMQLGQRHVVQMKVAMPGRRRVVDKSTDCTCDGIRKLEKVLPLCIQAARSDAFDKARSKPRLSTLL